jgi:putative ABC transport system permease protein
MFLALREMRRAKARFGLLAGAVGLLLFLILVQQTLQAGLINAFVGGLRNQSAEVVVFSVDGRRNLQGSVVPPDLEAAIRSVDGVGRAGQLGQTTVSVTADGQLTSATVLGYAEEGLGSPTDLEEGRLPERPGEAVANVTDADLGFAVGDTVRVEPGGLDLTVVGAARDINLLVQPTLFVPYDGFVAAVAATNPDGGAPLPSAIAVEPAEGVAPEAVVERINAASDDADALTRGAAADATPGVANIRQSFQIIFALFALVVPLVTGLFFLIITFQKAAALTLLRAIGAPAPRLVTALLVQVVAVVAVGCALGTLLYLPFSGLRVGSIALSFQQGAVVGWTVALLVLSVLSSLVAVRRVLAIDPIEATTSAGGLR